MSVSSAVFGVALLLSATLQDAEAPASTCPVPRMPVAQRPVKPTRPVAPACVDEARNRHTCSTRVIRDYEGKIEAYSAAFDAYVNAVNGYVGSLSAYVEEVNAYVQCEQHIVMPSRVISG